MVHGQASDSDFVAEVHSTFEPLVIARICQPLLRRLPESIHPNTISLVNHLASWVVVWLAILSPRLGPIGQPLALVLAGCGMFATMILDCLDGMQARRTGRCSKLGELLDHWLDAIHVPLVSVGMVLALQLPPWAVAGVVITAAMVYNAQLVLYHHRGVYVHTPTSGVDAQVGVSVAYLVAALTLTFVDRHARWLDLLLAVVAAVGIVSQLRQCAFYYVRLRGLVLHHLKFVLLCCGWAALYLFGAIDSLAFVLAITFTSFRITGSYVLGSIVKQPYHGFDWGLALWIALLAAAQLLGRWPWQLEPLRPVLPYLPQLPYLALLYLVGRNLAAFAARFADLRPAASPGAAGEPPHR